MKKVNSYFLNIFFFAFVLFALNACTPENDGCTDSSKITNGSCPTNYDPVCGCDSKTYTNSCVATNAGVLTTTKGVCPK